MPQQEVAPFGIFTLVSYVPAPLGDFLDGLRRSLPVERYAPQAHITLVPPRPLRVSLAAASAFVQQIVSQFSSFRVVLGGLHRFPETNVFYLDLAQGQNEVRRLHDALNSSVLAHQERFEFRPHLTVGGPVPDAELNATEERLSDVWLARTEGKEFKVTEVVALWFDPANGTPDWTRVWSRQFDDVPAFRANAAGDQP